MTTTRKPTDEATYDIPDIPTGVPVTGVTEVTPRHRRGHVLTTLGLSLRTLQRYQREYGQALTATQGESNEWLFSDEDVSFLGQIKAAKSDAARTGIAARQTERLAQLSAGVTGGRREAEAIRRELRAMPLPSVRRRVAALLYHVPHLAGARMLQRLIWYMATWHTTDLAQMEAAEAPALGTVEREFRRQTNARSVASSKR